MLVDGPEEVVKVVGLVLQKIYLLGPLLVLCDFLVLDLLLEGLFLLLELLDLFFVVDLFLLEIEDGGVQFRSPLLGLELLPHGEGEGRLVEHLVGVDGHVELVPDPHEENSPFGAVDGDLADDLVVALLVELFADGADPRIPEDMAGGTWPA